ncbi:MAG: hypothetical protein F2789_12680 [Actinobacteria bacterium]|nr:hypothetical protein [Actinomycetota bacterium]
MSNYDPSENDLGRPDLGPEWLAQPLAPQMPRVAPAQVPLQAPPTAVVPTMFPAPGASSLRQLLRSSQPADSDDTGSARRPHPVADRLDNTYTVVADEPVERQRAGMRRLRRSR